MRRWLVWNLVVWLSFGALEYQAIKSRQPTLSVWLRASLGSGTTRRDRHLRHILFTGLLVWFFGHIVLSWGPYLDDQNRLRVRRTLA